MRFGLLCLLVAPLIAQEVKKQDISPRAVGAVFEASSKDGLLFRYRLPLRYKKKTPINLVFILHGSNLTRGWGFANHGWKSFRPDDLVVCPDGTTSNGRGGFNFLQSRKDLKRLHGLHGELAALFEIRNCYLYGHSQGSFFAFYYAGAYPKMVHGVVGHASGVWIGTSQSKRQHHQAIVLMHGTRDPVVNYGLSVGGHESFAKARYPMLRLRSLEGWNHWPAEHNGPVPHTSQQLAWVEGMTTKDPGRMAASFKLLAKVENTNQHDFAALHSLAVHLSEHDAAPASLRKKAKRAMKAVESLARLHVKALESSSKKSGGKKLDGGSWSGHLPLFLRRFRGVPAADALRGKWSKILDKHESVGRKQLQGYWKAARRNKSKEAFIAGLTALRTAWLHDPVCDPQLLKSLVEWRKNPRAHQLDKKIRATYDKTIEKFDRGREAGRKLFYATNEKYHR